MPHSEIAGSKVAHTSPTLIAACHVLHRLCMPRHPPNTLTSRLRLPHHQRQRCKSNAIDAACSATRCKTCFEHGDVPHAKKNRQQHAACQYKPIHNVKEPKPPQRDDLKPFSSAWNCLFFREGLTPHTPVRLSGRTRSRPRRSTETQGSLRDGGACRDRTDDLKLAKLPLSQLS